MIYQKYTARCCPVYQHERNENASFLSIFNGGGRPKWRFSNFPRFWKNSSALGSFNCIFENNSLKALFGQNMKKLKILKLSPDSRYLQKLALKQLRPRAQGITIATGMCEAERMRTGHTNSCERFEPRSHFITA